MAASMKPNERVPWKRWAASRNVRGYEAPTPATAATARIVLARTRCGGADTTRPGESRPEPGLGASGPSVARVSATGLRYAIGRHRQQRHGGHAERGGVDREGRAHGEVEHDESGRRVAHDLRDVRARREHRVGAQEIAAGTMSGRSANIPGSKNTVAHDVRNASANTPLVDRAATKGTASTRPPRMMSAATMTPRLSRRSSTPPATARTGCRGG